MRLRVTVAGRSCELRSVHTPGDRMARRSDRILGELLRDPARRGLVLRMLGPELPPQVRDDAAERALRARMRTGGIGLLGRERSIAQPPFHFEESEVEGDEQAVAVHWIAIELVDMKDQPVAGERYRIKTPDGRVHEGRTDRAGRARIDGLPDAGNCEIAFPDLDQDAWKPA
jgi:hypothetical protein